jgi:uroporphyrin-III C-methyltransferase
VTEPNAPTPAASYAPAAELTVNAPAPAAASPLPGRWIAAGTVLLAVLCTAAMAYAWSTQQRVKSLEHQLVKRQDESGAQAAEAQLLAKQAQETSRDAAAKLALVEARVAEATLQRSQLEELIQSLSRSRDENLLADVEASIRVALQQTAITGSAEPLLIALKQAEERLVRQNQPRLDGVRRAIAHDLERVRGAAAVDVATLALRLDEAIRLVDELPLLSAPDRRAAVRGGPRASAPVAVGASAAPAASATEAAPKAGASWLAFLRAGWSDFSSRVWDEARSLVRVTPIDQPEAMLIAPEQAFFLRENLKLRLLNARLALLSRQFDTAQSDLRDAQSVLERYFDRGSKRVVSAGELVRQVSTQARQVVVPRPDATLTAIAAVAGSR